ncbi:hypothetical protein TrVE_jg6194 [Triparma verrucosa]|uniref:Uncharacterized protein n=1 Tax=Triparma verrucosa TaxID=1606542 RepID=A0A9W7EW97_9STRA|nr:hypothetical protein TrVE_jg6194 [Triparma verrucosa]
MPPKKKKATSPKSKNSKAKAKLKSSKVAVAPPPKEPEVITPAPAPKCPWAHLRSPYGGKMSPADEWSRLTSYSPSAVEIYKEMISAETSPNLVILNAVVNYESLPTPIVELPSSTGSEETSTPTPTPHPPCDKLQIINCELESLLIPSEILQRLVCLCIPGSCLSSEAVITMLSSSPSFLRSLSLVGNALSSIPPQLFSHTPKLLELDLSYNKDLGSSFPTDAFSANASLSLTLRSLNLESCGIGEGLVDSLTSLNNLRVLNISANEITMAELIKFAPEVSPPPQFVGKFEKFNFHPMNSVTKEDAFPSTFSKLLKKMICLKQLDDKPFSQSLTIDIEELSKLDIAADDENTKDSSTCSCVYGNPCTSKYNCKTHIWFRRFEVARQAREDPNFDIAKALAGT